MAKKKVQRTDWKKEFVLVQQDRNNLVYKCERLEGDVKQAATQLSDMIDRKSRLSIQAREVSDLIENVVTIAEMMTSAPAHSIPGEGGAGYGRDVLLGMLLEKLRNIPRPVPF